VHNGFDNERGTEIPVRILETLAVVLGLSLLAVACDQTVDEIDAGNSADSGSLDAGNSGPSVLVTYNSAQHTVVLADLTAVDFEGTPSAKLSEAILAAVTGHTMAQLQIDDLLADDGFSPNDSSNCAGRLPVAGADTEQGFIALDSRNLGWASALSYPGCMGVDGLHEIKVSDQ
jgi:hypothetical protein